MSLHLLWMDVFMEGYLLVIILDLQGIRSPGPEIT